MLTIHGSPLSPHTNKVRYVANYLDLPFNFKVIDLVGGEQRLPKFLQINPTGKVPAITDGNFNLGESNAIVRFLADKQRSDLYPKDLQQRAVVDQWMDFISQHIANAFFQIMFNTYFCLFFGIKPDQNAIIEGRQSLAQHLPVIENQLQKHHYVTGDKISIADINLISVLDSAELCELNLAMYPLIVTLRNNLMKEKFYRKCHESYTETFNKIASQVAK